MVICSREGPYFPFWYCSTSNLFSPPYTSFLPERLLLYAWQKVTCVPRCYLENTYMLRFGAINFFGGHSPSHLSLGIHFSVSLACYYPFLFCAPQIFSLYFDYFWDIIPLQFLVWAPEFLSPLLSLLLKLHIIFLTGVGRWSKITSPYLWSWWVS